MKDKIAVIINKARAAQNIFAQYSQEKVDETVTAVAWAICNPKNNKHLSESAVASTGLGKIKH